jgi:hypothetical protein
MKRLSSIVAAGAAVVLSACANIPRGPALSYEQLLPNTHENPVWARNVVHSKVQSDTPAPSAPR